MPTPEPPASVSLKVKVPPGYLSSLNSSDDVSGNSDQFDLGTLPVTTTIGSIRHQIQQLIPSNPTPDHQRILYGGRALVDNDQTLSDALNIKRDPEQREYVVHLLIKADSGGGMSRTPTPNTQQARFARVAAGLSPPQGQQPAHNPALEALHQQNQQLMQQHQNLNRQFQMQQQMMFNQFAQQAGAQRYAGAVPIPQAQGQAYPSNQTEAQPTQSNSQAPDQSQNSSTQQSTHPPHHHHHHPHRHGQGVHIEGVGPEGQRFQIHQHTMHVPFPTIPGGRPGVAPVSLPMLPGQHAQPTMPSYFPPPPNFAQRGIPAGMPIQPQQPSSRQPSALETARQNIAEMRRMLDEIAQQTDLTDEQRRQRIEEVQARARRVSDYIDPFNLSSTNGNNQSSTERRNTPTSTFQPPNGVPQPPNLPPLPRSMQNYLRASAMLPQQPQMPSNPNDVSVYLLSSPQGPQAILFSPQFGTHITNLMPTPTTQRQTQQGTPATSTNTAAPAQRSPQQPPLAQQLAAQNPAVDPVAQAARQHLAEGAQAQAAAQAANPGGIQDPLGLQPILNHFWMLFRILIFAYFLLGANLGWQRPVILMLVGAGFWFVRMGLMADGGAVRRWWEDVVGVPQRPGQGAAAGAEGAAQPVAPQQPAPANGQPGGRQAMPTPEQVAQRLLNEAEQRDQQRRNWLREQIRPIERVVALLLASLWPGIGEAHVREQRRLREEEEVARRRAEEEAARVREAEEKKDDVGGSDGVEKKDDGVGEAAKAEESGEATGSA